MLMKLVLPLLLVGGLALGAKKPKTQLGMALDDERILNRNDSCPQECPRDCKDVYDKGYRKDGPYTIYISTDKNSPLLVYCDMKTSGGGWTVFQDRIDGSVDFYRGWADYVAGFGTVLTEHWMGLHKLHLILAQKKYRLRIDLEDFDGIKVYAEYLYFSISSPLNKYALEINRYEGGTAGDGLTFINNLDELSNMQFSTRDQVNDNWPYNSSCPVLFHGAWWYNRCARSNLNANYTTDRTTHTWANIHWYPWRVLKPLKSTSMKFRPM